MHPYALETAYQWLKHFKYVYYGCMKQSEVDISLNHDVMASFALHKPLKCGTKIALEEGESWLAMSGFVSVGYTPQTTDICVCHQHVDNVGPTHR